MGRTRRGRGAAIGITAGIAALIATTALALTRDVGSGAPRLPLAALSTQDLRPVPPAGRPGPEGVPVPDAPALAPARVLTGGEQIDGITCQAGEQVLFHIHAHLTVFVDGTARQVPAGIGIAPPYEVQRTPAGPFIAGATCYMWLHTHAADGIIHTESPIKRTYTLGDFFDIWGQPLDGQHIGTVNGPVTALLNGRVYTGNPRSIPLLAQAQIQLEVGSPLVAPEQIAFPEGL
jgi:hypothetical protein